MSLNADQFSINTTVLNISSKICEEMSIAFSANDAHQSIADMQPAGNEDSVNKLWRLLSTVGDRVGVKYREIDSGFRDLIRTIKQAGPIVVAIKPLSENNPARIAVVLGSNGSKLVIDFEGEEQTISQAWLKRNALVNEQGAYRWMLAQPMFAASAASAYNYRSGSKDNPLSPLKRFIALLQPEMRDIRSVIIFSVFVGILSLTLPLAVEALVNTISFGRYLQPLIVLTLIVFIFLAFRAVLSVMMTVVVEIIQRRIFVRVVDDLAMRLTRVPVPYLKAHYGPELVNRFFDVVTVQKVTAKLILESVMLVLQTIIGLTVLAFLSSVLLGYDIGLIALMGIVLFVIGRRAIETSKSESALKYETGAWLQEIVRHPTTFKFNGGLGFALNRADELAGRYVRCRQEHFRILLRQVSFSMMMQAVAATALLGLGGYLVIEQQLTLGQLVAAELIVTVILGSFAKVGKDLESFYDLMASVDKLGKLFDLPGEPADRLRLARHDGAAEIELVDLTFLNRQGGTISAKAKAGTSVAIVGPAGSGKTKVIETVAGLHAPVNGYALMNDFRVDLIGAASLQSQLAFVNEIEVFDGTIEENIRLGRSEIDSASINDIFSKLGLQETVTRMDSGYKTRLSTTGFPLSTGQAVRLVLARALVSKPPALLIDSLLDRLADDDLIEVLGLLDAFKGETTILIATGRTAIAEWTDQKWEI